MPTPFQHLVYAKNILTHPSLPHAIHEYLQQEASAYYFGNTAVDVQSITGQSRFETHFYHLADIGSVRPHEVMLQTWPDLADPHRLAPAHAAFISGYLVHLAWDEVWADRVFIPFYLESDLWQDRLTRSMHHNALRVLLDQQAERMLRAWARPDALIRHADPEAWLPFVADVDLCRWRDWLAAQLEDPAQVETAQVFAQRMQVTVEQLQHLMDDVDEGRAQPAVPGLCAALAAFENQAQVAALQILARYWTASPVARDIVPVTHDLPEPLRACEGIA